MNRWIPGNIVLIAGDWFRDNFTMPSIFCVYLLVASKLISGSLLSHIQITLKNTNIFSFSYFLLREYIQGFQDSWIIDLWWTFVGCRLLTLIFLDLQFYYLQYLVKKLSRRIIFPFYNLMSQEKRDSRNEEIGKDMWIPRMKKMPTKWILVNSWRHKHSRPDNDISKYANH